MGSLWAVYGESMGSLGESTYRYLWQSRAVNRHSGAVYGSLWQSRQVYGESIAVYSQSSAG